MHELLADSPSPADDLPPHVLERQVREVGRFRRGLLVFAVSVLALTACTSGDAPPSSVPTAVASGELSPSPMSLSPNQQAAQTLLLEDGAYILQQGQPSHGGLHFPSEIQDKNDQTDRDVGAASVGMGLLALAEQNPGDSRWLTAAEKTATWLTAVSKQDSHGGRYWPDYANDSGDSDSHYTSFDDGALGIGDFYWRLYEKTGKSEYKTIALQTVQWTVNQAQNVGSAARPIYRWQWDAGDGSSQYYMGMGEGETGVIETLTVYYQRTKDSDPAFAAQCKRYIEGGLRNIAQVRAALADELGSSKYARAIPETGVIGDDEDGDTTMDSGYLSGAAGTAYMYLKLYQAFGNKAYLQDANVLFGWLDNTSYGPKVVFADGSAAWKLALDPEGDDNNHYATGVEEGNAGIGWVYLQAYLLADKENLPDQQKYLDTAKQAADWLLKVAIPDGSGGLSWREYENPASPLIHPNLDNGAAGIGTFLLDMYEATGDKRYLVAAQGAQKWLANTAIHRGNTVSWKDSDDGKPFSGDTSAHWGNAGIAQFMARMAGYTGDDTPGEQSAILVAP